MEGAKVVPLMKGAWELVWRADSNCGFLICGFNLERDVRRNENGAVLPKGEYISSVLKCEGLVVHPYI